MAIDITVEKLIPLSEAPRAFPMVGEKYVALDTVRRWTRQGCRGERLETYWIGGKTCTSREAIMRFTQAISTSNDLRLDAITAKSRNSQSRQDSTSACME